MALTQIGKEGITGISNSANANAITIDSGENVALSGTLGVTGAATLSSTAGIAGNATVGGTLGVTGVLTGTSLDISGNIDIDGTSNLDVVDIDGTLNVAGETTLQTHLNMGDGDIIKLGASADLTIQHDGSNSYIKDEGTGNLYIRTDGTTMNLQAGSDNAVKITKDAQVELYHNNVKKIETTSTGVTSTGTYVGTVAGSASAPNFAVTSGSLGANGMFVASANTLGFGSGGAERLQINSSGVTVTGNLNITNGHVSSGVTHTYNLYGATGTGGSAAYVTYSFVGDGNTGMFSGTADTIKFATGGTEKVRINASGHLLLGTTTSRGKLTLGLNAASSDGIMLDNSNGGATMDIALLGSGYAAHGAAAGEIWFYSPDNINIGGATGNGNHIKFIGNNTLRMQIHGSKPQTETHGVKEYFYHGSLASSQVVVNIDIAGISSAGVALVEATYNHYSINQYGASRTSNLGLYGGGIISTHDIQSISSANGGNWTYSTPTSGTIRITKNAGSYVGGGYYWVKITTYV